MDYVVEFMGLFIIYVIVENYFKVGVKWVIIFVFSKDFEKIFIFVVGVNYFNYNVDIDKIVFNVSCIINCLVSIVKILDDNFGIVEGLMIIVYVMIVI